MSANELRYASSNTLAKSFAHRPDISHSADTNLNKSMSLQDLTPANSQRALETALNVFKRFLAAEDTTLEYIRATLVRDVKGLAFVKLMDRFAMHLAFSNGRGGQPLARNTIMSYYRSVKNWLLDDQPQHRQVVEKQLLKMGRTLERYCLKRNQGGMVNKAPACTKDDLRILVDGMHYDASTPKDFQDAALLAIMWYAFGRSSDLAFVKKSNLSVASDNVFFLRLIRAKTSEEQGLSLYPDQHSYVTCPLHAIGMALVMQSFPSNSLLQLPMLIDSVEQAAAPASSGITLVEALECCYDDEGEPGTAASSTSEKRQTTAPLKMQGYVNRVVKAASERQARANPTASLSSHSFRRGGAQYANRDASLSAQWIFDRGSWNMSATNKAFAYVVNTTSEDMKVSKVLSDWKSNDNPVIASFSAFDSTSRKKIDGVMWTLFSSSLGFEDRSLNVDRRVADLLCATLIRHFPEFNARHDASPYVVRVRECLAANNVSMSEMLAWSVQLGRQHGSKTVQGTSKTDEKFTREEKLINQQNIIISELLNSNRELYARLAALEHAQGPAAAVRSEEEQQEAQDAKATSGAELKRRRALPMSASSMWFEWYTKVPRLWDVCESRQYKSTSKQVVAYMKLFLPRGFVFDPSSATYCDDVMRLGKEAEGNMTDHLRSLGINRKFGSGLLKQLRELHQQGQLDTKIREYLIRVKVGRIADPAPKETQDMFSKFCV